MDNLAGKYHVQGVHPLNENDWHFVTLTPSGDKGYRWKNRAGVSWSLTYDLPDDAALQVGTDCPYHGDGHTECEVVKDSKGNGIALMGPWGERYSKCPEQASRETYDWSRPPLKISSGWGSGKEGRHALILAVASTGADWRDLAFLAALAASTKMNQGQPAVLVSGDQGDKDDDALADFLTRYQPNKLSIFAASKEIVQTEFPNLHQYGMDSLHPVTVDLAKAAWSGSCSHVVIAPMEDYAAALLASSVATRIRAPLFFVNGGAWHKDVLNFTQQSLRPSEVVLVRGKNMTDDQAAACMIRLGNPASVPIMECKDVIAWLASQNVSVEYLAIVNPNDRTAETECASRKLSLTASVYTAKRNGLVLPIDNIPVYNKLGRLKQYDQNALQVALQGLRSTISACPEQPKHVAIVGGFNVMPTCQTDSKFRGVHAVSDIPYGQLTGDSCCGSKKFRDIPFGRIYAESLVCGSLLAARTINYEHLVDPKWTGEVIEGGAWGFPELGGLVQVTGLCSVPKRMFQKDIDQADVLEATAIFHKDHSRAQHLGNFVRNKTKALYSPAVVITRGCHGAGIDEGDATHGTVAGRMLGRGCVAYLGAPRTATTESTLTEIAFFHEMIYSSEPLSVGQALCEAYNKSMVNHLDGGPMDDYCFENEVLLGDPALVPSFVGSGASKSTSMSAGEAVATCFQNEDNIVTVNGPSSWRKTPIERGQLDEWKFKGDLYTYVAGNVEQETVWGPGYDKQELYYCVTLNIPSGTNVKEVKALDATENIAGKVQMSDSADWTKRWWPSGRFFVQDNKDESTTVRWRLRLLDYDMPTGDIEAELKSARFQLVIK